MPAGITRRAMPGTTGLGLSVSHGRGHRMGRWPVRALTIFLDRAVARHPSKLKPDRLNRPGLSVSPRPRRYPGKVFLGRQSCAVRGGDTHGEPGRRAVAGACDANLVVAAALFAAAAFACFRADSRCATTRLAFLRCAEFAIGAWCRSLFATRCRFGWATRVV